MTTSGTSTFDLDLNEIFEEAFERCGQELRTGYDFRTARRSLNLLTIEWANKGINLWTIEEKQISLVANQSVYPLPIDTIDLLDQTIRTGSGANQTDININRISESTYSTIPNKNATGRPIQVWVNRQSGERSPTNCTLLSTISLTDTTIGVVAINLLPSAGFILIGSEVIGYSAVEGNNLVNCFRGQLESTIAQHVAGDPITVFSLPSINIWPVPPVDDQYTFVYWRLRRIQDAGDGGTKTPDIPFRFIECLVAGLAYKLSIKLPNVDPNRVLLLKTEYEQQWQLASEEDREKAALRVVPRNMFYS